jgi:hypothetical protein
MLRIGRCFSAIRREYFNRIGFNFSSEINQNFVPTLINESKDFYSNVYGVVFEKHVLPHATSSFPWRAKNMKEYRKKMPNFVVVLVKKVLEDAGQVENQNEENKNLNNLFYPTSTYCRIKYYETHTELTGLYRVKLKKVEDVNDDSPKGVEIEEEPEEETSIEAVEDGGRKINLQLYSLET